MNKGRKTAIYGIYIALAFIFSYLESVLTLNVGIPGIKLGLANLVVITALYIDDNKTAMFVNLIRIILSGFMFGSMAGIIYSIVGGMISTLIMIFMKKTDIFSMIGVSITGGVTHNIIQVAVAVAFFDSVGIISYLPILMIAGTIAGIAIGILANIVILRIKRIKGRNINV